MTYYYIMSLERQHLEIAYGVNRAGDDVVGWILFRYEFFVIPSNQKRIRICRTDSFNDAFTVYSYRNNSRVAYFVAIVPAIRLEQKQIVNLRE